MGPSGAAILFWVIVTAVVIAVPVVAILIAIGALRSEVAALRREVRRALLDKPAATSDP